MKKNNLNSIIITLLGLLLISVTQTFAQKDFIQIVDPAGVKLDRKQLNIVNNLQNATTTSSLQFITLGNPALHISNGNLTVNLPGQGAFTAHVRDFEFESPSDYKWYGVFPETTGSITLFCESGNIFGHIRADGIEYDIQKIGTYNILIKYDTAALNGADLSVEPTFDDQVIVEQQSMSNKLAEVTSETRTTTGLVRVLFLYTSGSLTYTANINNTATMAINNLNTAVQNSDIGYYDLHFAKAGVVLMPNFVESYDEENPYADLHFVRNSPVAKSLRDQYEADVVILLPKPVYPPYYGCAFVGPSENSAYGLVEITHATSAFTFEHEVGHLFGCRHQRAEFSNPTGYAYGYKYETGAWFWENKWMTIMHQNMWGGEHERIAYFSSPLVEWDDEATGTTIEDNRRQLIEQGHTLENFRSYNTPPQVYIFGPAFGNNAGEYTWTANVSGGQGPFTYLWEYGYDGFIYNGVVSTDQSFTYPLPADADLYLKLTVTDANQTTGVDFHVTINLDTPPPLAPELSVDPVAEQKKVTINSEKISSIEQNNKISIFPNPAIDNITVSYRINAKSSIEINIVDLNGNTIMKLNEGLREKGNYKTQIVLDEIPSGIYTLIMKTNEESLSSKLVVI
ncbi:MAG: zinc-dependent metalloprotease [Bacteroidales bacterium]|nr:zinc-dependent metalloprotease [Bacteroidales bacterium]